jgi:hypothetical protein
MDEIQKTFETLIAYRDSLEAKFKTIKLIRENKKSLENIFPKGANIQHCANEMEAELLQRSNYLFCYLDDFNKKEGLSNHQKEFISTTIKTIQKKYYSEPKVKVNYED